MMRGLIAGLMLVFSTIVVAEPEGMADFLHLNWLDSSILPQDNFYGFANGGWQKKNPIPPEYGSWGIFAKLQKQNVENIHHMLAELSQDHHFAPGTIEQKVAD